MWIIAIIIVIIVAYSVFSKATNKVVDNTINNFEEDKWWLMGAMADMHNKKRDKK